MDLPLEFKNREIAVAIWVVIALCAALYSPGLRQSVLAVARAATKRLLLLAVLLVVVYVWAETLVLEWLGLWDGAHVAKTWLWIFTVGMLSVFTVGQADNPNEYLRKEISRSFKLSVVFTFLLNLYQFPLWIEVLVIPPLVLVAIVGGVAESKAKREASYAPVKKWADNLLALFGLIVAAYSAHSIYVDWVNFATWNTLKRFLVPIELSLLFVPLIYYFALLTGYENLFLRLRFLAKDKDLLCLLRFLVLVRCNILLRRIGLWARLLNGLNLDSTSAVLASFRFSSTKSGTEPPDFFRGHSWGTEPKPYMHKVSGPTEDGLTLYTLEDDWPPTPLFGCKVHSECFHFDRDRLYAISVFLDGKRAFNEGRYELQSIYGPAAFVSERGDLFRWKWPNKGFEIVLSYESTHDRVTVYVTSEIANGESKLPSTQD